MDRSPHTDGFVNVNGIRLHYLDWGGRGPALLFLPGRGCNGHIFDEFAPRFTPHFRVLALDRRGHGDSDYPETGYDIDTLVEDIRQFLDCRQIERVILAGHSLAGIELTHFAALYPERVLKLVFLDATYNYACPEYQAMVENHPNRKIQIPGADQDFDSLEAYAAFLRFAYPGIGTIWGDWMNAHLLHSVAFNPAGKLVDKTSDRIDQAIVATTAEYQPEYRLIRAPTLAFIAHKPNTYFISSDYMTTEQQAELIEYFDTVIQPWNELCDEQFRREAPHAKIVDLPDGHHYCFIPQADLVFTEMLDFLLADPAREA